MNVEIGINSIAGPTEREQREEFAHTLTHGFGLIASVVGVGVMIFAAATRGDMWHVIGCTVFGLSLILVYASSTLYHGTKDPVRKVMFQRLDHIAIYLLIAGHIHPLYPREDTLACRLDFARRCLDPRGDRNRIRIHSEEQETLRLCCPLLRHGLDDRAADRTATAEHRERRCRDALTRGRDLYGRVGVLFLGPAALQPCDLARFRPWRQRAALRFGDDFRGSRLGALGPLARIGAKCAGALGLATTCDYAPRLWE